MSSLNRKPLLVALTGGIGSGKSTVSQEFELLKVPCFNADKVAGSYYNDAEFRKLLLPLFGSSIFDEKGSVIKSRIAQIVFSNPEKLQQLNAIIHPKVMSDFDRWVEEHNECDYVIQENAILFEHGFDNLFDVTIAVYAPEDVRIRRVMKRDGASFEAVEARIKNQMNEEEKRGKATFVIMNYKGEKYRKKRIESLHKKLLKLALSKRN
jgi:dephospho-CoA kinase